MIADRNDKYSDRYRDFLLTDDDINGIKIDIAIGHLEEVRREIQEDIRRYRSSRDMYLIQLLVIIGALTGLVITNYDNMQLMVMALLIIPIPVLVFTYHTLSSHMVYSHGINYLQYVLEPNFEKLTGCPRKIEWTAYRNAKVGGIDLWLALLLVFMYIVSVIIPVLCLLFVLANNIIDPYVVASAVLIYALTAVIVTRSVFELGSRE